VFSWDVLRSSGCSSVILWRWVGAPSSVVRASSRLGLVVASSRSIGDRGSSVVGVLGWAQVVVVTGLSLRLSEDEMGVGHCARSLEL
jgi:hypothetical protein